MTARVNLAPGPFHQRGASTPADAELFMVGGTWNPSGDGVTQAFIDRLDMRIDVTFVDYPATAHFGTSIPAGEVALRDALGRSRAKYRIVSGYSQGSIVAGNVADTSTEPDLCALIADPLRAARSPILNGNVGGYGILGERRVRLTPLVQVAAYADPIAALVAGSPLRTLADILADAQPNMDAWARAMLHRSRTRNFQQWWSPNYWQDWLGATGWITNYFTGRHTDAYVREGLCTLLADQVNARVAAALS